MEISDKEILNEIITCNELRKEWNFDEIGIICIGYDEFIKKYPTNEIQNKVIYIHKNSIGLFFELIGQTYRVAMKNIREYPLECSTICLMINGDCSIAWNKRFELKINEISEMRFTECLSKRFKKGFLIYYYREMIYSKRNRLLKQEESKYEFNFITKAIAKYSRGYHLYKHLLWLIDHSHINHIYLDIMKWCEEGIINDSSDYSLMNIRKKVIETYYCIKLVNGSYTIKLNEINQQIKDFFILEYVWVSTLIHLNPQHESLWLYHYTISQLIKCIEPKLTKESKQQFNFTNYIKLIYEQKGCIKVSREFTELNISFINQYSFIPINSIEFQFLNYEKNRVSNQKVMRLVERRLTSNLD
ncbi:hypothetical protein EHI8A_165630 [Entamoeba histolytica HM-1:IMSS-B]|uniref:Geranylgeranyl transferase type-2 subunit alpha n=6 Tax=Entamoeba histolytica TaxID=5759 RepID=C4MB47_ENTH1|nr:hypothetical protein EHI_042730 [Entamoeba histolytica HM-1:IMSS]EMD44875.1 Hypothetical protein EHI5A_190500 [Entamoeba histolytica KU27]EMH74834.1 hypothetical protein EHI8A_165630 [Entamoeba histolytica HM-1:IMSS-B]EMS12576.1 hypothetical protein KM1_239410 [Entamoeba histolytica HM-3:IMSS]ENY65927.1 hypothetical protein EHI7A_146360 [Entamoeba histolytica HM-1:IMSS-A]GAT99129.1 hypothetical protein CL6EHI_042730 [Entamoeba histolytica]|eukprot:XP_654434.1 hypothetical protein EHI_042730 [Entamoeba histolytica HM-1:IMSS]